MKQLFSTSRNIRFVPYEHDGKAMLIPEIELVLTTVEKTNHLVGGDLLTTMSAHDFRCSITMEGARQLAQHLHDWTNEAEKLLDDMLGGVATPEVDT